jgi:hypothetical protein
MGDFDTLASSLTDSSTNNPPTCSCSSGGFMKWGFQKDLIPMAMPALLDSLKAKYFLNSTVDIFRHGV